MTAATFALRVYGPYPSGDPRKPFAVGAAAGDHSWQWKFGQQDRAQEIALALLNGDLEPKDVFA